jgi:hypothetical protein
MYYNTFFPICQGVSAVFFQENAGIHHIRALIFQYYYGIIEIGFMVIPLTHHKNSGYAELKVLGVYLFVYRIFSWCAKGIVMIGFIVHDL